MLWFIPKIAIRLVKTTIVSLITVAILGIGLAVNSDRAIVTRFIPRTWGSIPYLEKPNIKVFEVSKVGNIYMATRYVLTDNNRLYTCRFQGLSFDTLHPGLDEKCVVLTERDVEILMDIVGISVISSDRANLVNCRIHDVIKVTSNKESFLIPKDNRVSGLLLRTFARFSLQNTP